MGLARRLRSMGKEVCWYLTYKTDNELKTQMYTLTAVFRRVCAPQDECIAVTEVVLVHAPIQQTKDNIKQRRKKKRKERERRPI